MNRGDVWLLDLGGRAGRRPAVIVTRQAVIPHLNKLTVAEITSAGKGYPTEVPIGRKANLSKDSFVTLGTAAYVQNWFGDLKSRVPQR